MSEIGTVQKCCEGCPKVVGVKELMFYALMTTAGATVSPKIDFSSERSFCRDGLLTTECARVKSKEAETDAN